MGGDFECPDPRDVRSHQPLHEQRGNDQRPPDGPDYRERRRVSRQRGFERCGDGQPHEHECRLDRTRRCLTEEPDHVVRHDEYLKPRQKDTAECEPQRRRRAVDPPEQDGDRHQRGHHQQTDQREVVRPVTRVRRHQQPRYFAAEYRRHDEHHRKHQHCRHLDPTENQCRRRRQVCAQHNRTRC